MPSPVRGLQTPVKNSVSSDLAALQVPVWLDRRGQKQAARPGRESEGL